MKYFALFIFFPFFSFSKTIFKIKNPNKLDVKIRIVNNSIHSYNIKLKKKIVIRNLNESDSLKLVFKWKDYSKDMILNIDFFQEHGCLYVNRINEFLSKVDNESVIENMNDKRDEGLALLENLDVIEDLKTKKHDNILYFIVINSNGTLAYTYISW